jgi:hypothetical protein
LRTIWPWSTQKREWVLENGFTVGDRLICYIYSYSVILI